MPPLATIEAHYRRVAPVCSTTTVVQGRPPLLLCPPTAPLHEQEDSSLLSHHRQGPIREKLGRQDDRRERVVEPRRCCWGLTATIPVVASAVARVLRPLEPPPELPATFAVTGKVSDDPPELLAAAGAVTGSVRNRSCFVLLFRVVYAVAKMCGAVL
ncbi:uncharacterized protein [Arachis hypogaea]|uniref:uncharacterized protein isoform X2 n=1 Tax=Arachis hypogaea TaxID=3818 RepID=UPI000DECBDD2|nr:uncharacterized protein LOC112747722 [Arachis hypogaea]QHO53690.1 uncharacterized protein DS421_2g50170 [Arachis hypogaea]